MQVSVEAVLNQLARELAAAKSQQHTGRVREHLVAIRALCDVVLGEQEQATPIIEQAQHMPRQTAQVLSAAPVLLKEEGANGGSLLDF